MKCMISSSSSLPLCLPASISSVRDAVLIGILLSSVILVLFLRDWGTSLVAGLVIPITLFVTFIVLKMTNQSFNLMTLGGLAAAVGLVIDDAIVVLENIVLHRDAGQNRFRRSRHGCSSCSGGSAPFRFFWSHRGLLRAHHARPHDAAVGAGRKLRLGRRSFLPVIALSRHGLPPGHGRRRIHSRLLHTARQLAR